MKASEHDDYGAIEIKTDCKQYRNSGTGKEGD